MNFGSTGDGLNASQQKQFWIVSRDPSSSSVTGEYRFAIGTESLRRNNCTPRPRADKFGAGRKDLANLGQQVVRTSQAAMQEAVGARKTLHETLHLKEGQ